MAWKRAEERNPRKRWRVQRDDGSSITFVPIDLGDKAVARGNWRSRYRAKKTQRQ